MNEQEFIEFSKSLNKFMKILSGAVAPVAIGLLVIGKMDWFTTVCESYIYFMAGAYLSIFYTANKLEIGTASQFFRMVLGIAFALFVFGLVHIF